ncbi:hypothetical protein [Streptomyces sp. NPDC059874]|uniref:hypothetical protein n=1 Tax=Streptomyces sp. NPDC059874 TaxID=3346983 RepID=UPI00364858B4
MSFAVHARRVRDPGLPMHRRHSALGSAIVLYAPFGYRRTWQYLGMTGDLRRDPDALVRALDALELSREAWLAELAAFADRRRTEKRERHRRSPSAADIALLRTRRWWGPEGHRANVRMLRILSATHGGPFPRVADEDKARLAFLDATVTGHVSSYLAAGGFAGPGTAARLQGLLPELRQWRGRGNHESCRYFDRLFAMAEVIVADSLVMV